MEQFVHKKAHLSCAIVDLIFGVFYNFAAEERVVDGIFGDIFCAEVGCGEYGLYYLFRLGKGGPEVFGFRFSVQIITKVFHRTSPSTAAVYGTSGFPRVIVIIFSFGKYLKI